MSKINKIININNQNYLIECFTDGNYLLNNNQTLTWIPKQVLLNYIKESKKSQVKKLLENKLSNIIDDIKWLKESQYILIDFSFDSNIIELYGRHNDVGDWTEYKFNSDEFKDLCYNLLNKITNKNISKLNYDEVKKELFKYNDKEISFEVAKLVLNKKYGKVITEAFYGNVNWQNNMNALGNVSATMDSKLFATTYPETFLKLCPSYSYGDDKWFDKYIEERKPYGIPFLIVDVDEKNKTLKVIDHEGRHRVASVMRKEPAVDIPLAILYNKDKYNLPNIKTLQNEWKIISQNGDIEIPMSRFMLYNELPKETGLRIYDFYKDKKINESIVYSKMKDDDMIIILHNPTRKELKDNDLYSCRIVEDGNGGYYFADDLVFTHEDMEKILKQKNLPYVETIGEFYYYNENLFAMRDDWNSEEEYKKIKDGYFQSLLLNEYISKTFKGFNVEIFKGEALDENQIIKNDNIFMEFNNNINSKTIKSKKIVVETKLWINDQILYHGTNRNFDTFKPSKKGTFGKGIYLTPNPAVAKTYGDKLLKVKVNLKNPLYISHEMPENISNLIMYNKIDELQKMGYDGIINGDENYCSEVVVWNPKDIKIIKETKETNLNDNFKKWFGNSKVVDEQGNPLVVYHGTSEDFNEFNTDKQKNSSYYGKGFYFTNWSDVSIYGKNKKLVYLSIQNPLIIDESDINSLNSVEKILGVHTDMSDEEKLSDFEGWAKYTLGYRSSINGNTEKVLSPKGYDGIIILDRENDGERNKYIAFYPNQIKSINNNGNWSNESNNIFESENSNLEFYDSVRDMYDGTYYKRLELTKGNEVLGYIEYSEYDEEVYIEYIFIDEKYRRKGYGTQLVKKLQSLYPNTELNFGMLTDDGSKLYNSLDKNVIKNDEYEKKSKQLEKVNKWLNNFKKITDKDIDDWSDEEMDYVRNNTSKWQKYHNKQQELERWLENNKKQTIRIKESSEPSVQNLINEYNNLTKFDHKDNYEQALKEFGSDEKIREYYSQQIELLQKCNQIIKE